MTASALPLLNELKDGVRTLTLHRPKARNAMNGAMLDALLSALEEAEADEQTRVLVFRGAGGNFCAGGDIKEMAGARSASFEGDVDPVATLNRRFGHATLRIASSPLPTLALVEGAVLGGGFGLACVCDVVIGVQGVRFGLPETGLGVIPAQIAPFLVERLGFSEAKRLALTGARLDGDAALAVGLIHRLVGDDALEAAGAEVCARFLRAAPEATAATKALLRRFASVTNEDIEHAARVFARAARGDEAAEGMMAFMQKRRPKWAPDA
ncbi:MAG: enoyl-CoA hydratase/isomerase family protein [Myxococcota bacterium]